MDSAVSSSSVSPGPPGCSGVRLDSAGWSTARIRSPSPANQDWKYSVATAATAAISGVSGRALLSSDMLSLRPCVSRHHGVSRQYRQSMRGRRSGWALEGPTTFSNTGMTRSGRASDIEPQLSGCLRGTVRGRNVIEDRSAVRGASWTRSRHMRPTSVSLVPAPPTWLEFSGLAADQRVRSTPCQPSQPFRR
jgi:hypothetical protein